MAAVGGSIESISLAGRLFAVAADADSQRKLGGYENEFQANGDGATGRIIKTVVGWSLSGVNVEVDDSRSDDEYLNDLNAETDAFAVAITYASGVVYQGSGHLVDTKEVSSQNATAPLTLMGPGKLTQQ